MKKDSTVTAGQKQIFKQPKLTIGLDLGDRTSHYCILDEAGTVILERNLPTTPKGIQQVFRQAFLGPPSLVDARLQVTCPLHGWLPGPGPGSLPFS